MKDDKGATLANAYAQQNHLEYFAEISCAYFTGFNYHPFDRPGLKAHDPAGFALVEKLWEVPLSSERGSHPEPKEGNK